MASAESPGFYCPVCGQQVDLIRVWQEAASDRIRIFCEACGGRPGYQALPPGEVAVFDREGFARFAGRRLLRNAYSKEHPDAAEDGERA